MSRLTSLIMSLEESHAGQIQTLKDCLEAKHNQIVRLEAKVNQLAGSSEARDEQGQDENRIR